jgi:hypothetical protein
MPRSRVSARSGRGQIFPFAAAAGIYHDRASRQFGAFHRATSHQAGCLELSSRQKFNQSGAAMGDDMAVDTAVHAELWLIFAAMIGWIVLGCFLTAHDRHQAPGH